MNLLLSDLDFSRWDVVLTTLIPACINLGIFVYVFFFLPQNETNYIFGFFVFLIGFWQMGDGLGRMSISPETALEWYRISGVFTIFAITLGVLFAISITKGINNISNRYVLMSLCFPPIILLIIIIARLDEYDIFTSEKWYWVVNPKPTFVTSIIYLWISFGSFLMLALFWYNYLRTDVGEKKQIQLFLLAVGFTIPVLGGLTAEVLFPFFLKMDVIPVSSPLLSIFSITSLIAIKKFNLLEYSPKYKWNQILESMNEGILIVDNDDRIMYANKIFCELLGYKFKELNGKVANKFLFDGSELPQIKKELEERKHNKQVQYEIQLKSKTGEKIWVVINSSPFTDKAGNIIGSIGIQTNINQEKKGEALFRAMVENVEEIITLTDKDNKVIYVSPAIEKVTGYTPEEINGKPIFDLIHHDCIEEEKVSYQNLIISPGIFVPRVTCIVHKNGNLVWLEGSVTNLLNDPNIHAIVTNYHDITDRRAAEEKLRNNEERLRTIIDTEPECLKIVSVSGELLEMNPSGISMLGIKKSEDIIGKKILDYIHPDDKSIYTDLHKKVCKGASGQAVFRVIGTEQLPKWMDSSSAPLRNLNGDIYAVLSLTRDITKQKEAEEKLKASGERYDIVAKATSDTIWDWDILSNRTQYNEGLTKMFGYNLSDIPEVSGWWDEKIHPEDVERVINTVEEFYNSGNSNLKLEYRFLCSDGSYKFILDRAFLIRDESGKAIRMIGAMQDITERIKQIKEIEEQNKTLREIAWTQSHIVRAPLARIMGIVNLFNTNAINEEETREFLNYILTSANELDQVIKTIVLKANSEVKNNPPEN
ncbi:MAG: PAS domain S-box protein [Bacteroidota bacterium]|nr:PAS domain S-box protein [Bacteroidota bacterium]